MESSCSWRRGIWLEVAPGCVRAVLTKVTSPGLVRAALEREAIALEESGAQTVIGEQPVRRFRGSGLGAHERLWFPCSCCARERTPSPGGPGVRDAATGTVQPTPYRPRELLRAASCTDSRPATDTRAET